MLKALLVSSSGGHQQLSWGMVQAQMCKCAGVQVCRRAGVHSGGYKHKLSRIHFYVTSGIGLAPSVMARKSPGH